VHKDDFFDVFVIVGVGGTLLSGLGAVFYFLFAGPQALFFALLPAASGAATFAAVRTKRFAFSALAGALGALGCLLAWICFSAGSASAEEASSGLRASCPAQPRAPK
jgi:amino acid transporter